MGLHLCYELALPRQTPATVVAERVRILHEAATRLPFAKVSSLVRVTDGDALGSVNVFDCSLEEGDRMHGEPYVWHWHSCCKTQYACIVGALHDAVGDRARTEGAIFKHPEFEQLETTDSPE